MNLPGPVALVFLLIITVLLPLAAIRSRRYFRSDSGGGPTAEPPPVLPSRASIWARTAITQALLLALAWYAGAGFGYRLFDRGPLGGRAWAAAALTLLACLALQWIVRATRGEDERRGLAVLRLAPRRPREWALWGATVALASVAEEAAYRGVGMAIVEHMTGDVRIAALVMAAAFAGAHAVQGWKSCAVIFVLALLMHALVQFTATLVLAMAVHALFDVVAGIVLARDARRHDAAALSDSSPRP